MEHDPDVALQQLFVELLEKELREAEATPSADMLTREYEYRSAYLDYLREQLTEEKARLRRLLRERWDAGGLDRLGGDEEMD